MGRVGDEALLRVEGTVKTFQQPVDRVGEIPQLVAGSAGESLVDVARAEICLMAVFIAAAGATSSQPPASRARVSPGYSRGWWPSSISIR
jgi:hypothetical protein